MKIIDGIEYADDELSKTEKLTEEQKETMAKEQIERWKSTMERRRIYPCACNQVNWRGSQIAEITQALESADIRECLCDCYRQIVRSCHEEGTCTVTVGHPDYIDIELRRIHIDIGVKICKIICCEWDYKELNRMMYYR